jgi:hypothetical protein
MSLHNLPLLESALEPKGRNLPSPMCYEKEVMNGGNKGRESQLHFLHSSHPLSFSKPIG